MKAEKRKIKFKCSYGGEGYNMNCFATGCIHQINNDCPIIERARAAEIQKQGAEDEKNRRV